MMQFRFLLSILFVSMLSLPAEARSYFVKASGGTGSGLNDRTAWNFARLRDAALLAGDSVFFKRGDVFYGALRAQNGVVYAAYGRGADPLISGFQKQKDWVPEGKGIYSVTVRGSTPQIVLFDGQVQPMGRFPNTGYLPFTAVNGKSAFTSGALMGGASWAGAEAVVRSAHWVLDRVPVASVVDSVLTMAGKLSYVPVKGFGFFLQNHLATLDQPGEWYAHGQKLFVFFGNENPAKHTVQTAVVDGLLFLQNKRDVQVIGIRFEGTNGDAVLCTQLVNCRLKDCHFRFIRRDAVSGYGTTGFSLQGGSIRLAGSRAILLQSNHFKQPCSGTLVQGVEIDSTGMIPGMGVSGVSSMTGIIIEGDSNVVEKNRITNTGYNAIRFTGSNDTIRKNYIANFCAVVDDGAGIYTWHARGDTATIRLSGRVIAQNIVLNGATTAFRGTNGILNYAEGIYLDDNTGNVVVTGNVCANNANAGIYVHNANHVTLSNNLCYNNGRFQINYIHDTLAGPIYNLMSTGNILVARHNQAVMNISTVSDDWAAFGVINKNIYSRPSNEANAIRVYNRAQAKVTGYTLAAWKTLFGYDSETTGTPPGLSAVDSEQVFLYNASDAARQIKAPWPFRTPDGKRFGKSFVLSPWTGIVGIKEGGTVLQKGDSTGDGADMQTGKPFWSKILLLLAVLGMVAALLFKATPGKQKHVQNVSR